MQRERWHVAGLGAIVGIVGVAWLGPLMLDQFVLFADQEQTATAAASRDLMAWPALLIALAASLLALAGRARPAAGAALPLLAVGLAYAMPNALWQLVAYGFTAPISMGAMLAAVVPIHGRLAAPWVLAALLLAGLAAALTTVFLAALAIIGLVAWWLLSRPAEDRRRASALD